MNPAENATELEVYRHLVKQRGKAAAEHWLRGRRVEKRCTPRAGAIERSRWQESQLNALIEGARGQDLEGKETLTLAERLIGAAWREKLGSAYPLVLLTVKAALESGARPGE